MPGAQQAATHGPDARSAAAGDEHVPAHAQRRERVVTQGEAPGLEELVPRAGAASRFLPVKDLAELEGRRDEIAAVLSARLGLRL